MILQSNFIKWFILLVLIMGASFYISSNWYQLMLIQGRSMEPEYHHLQLVLLDKHSKTYTAGDVVAFECEGLSAVLVKRIAASPGEKVQIVNGTLYVNNTASKLYSKNAFKYSGILSEELLLEDQQYIVIGDNIAESTDSRDERVGNIDEKNILGIVQ